MCTDSDALGTVPRKVSVNITCYNYARFLTTSLESALGQTYRNLDVLVVDDGSTDDIGDVMRRYRNDPRVHYIRQQNRGQAAARNVAIRESDGPLVAFLDADDAWEPNKLERQVPLFHDPAVGVVYSGVSKFDENGCRVPFEGFPAFLRPRCGRITEHLVSDNVVPFSSSVVLREALERVGGFDESVRMGDDWDLWLRISLHYDFAVVDEPLIRYREGHPGQISRKTEERFMWADRILSRFLEKHPDAVSPSVMRRSRAYSYALRADYYRATEWPKSTRLLLKALRCDRTFLPAYRGLLKNLVMPMIRGRA